MTQHNLSRRPRVRAADPADYGRGLRQRRAWYAEDAPPAPDADAAAPGDQAPPAPSAETSNTGSSQEHMIPKSRFDEINERMKKAEAALAEQQRQSEEAEQKRLKEQGKYQQLYEDASGKVTTLEAQIRERDDELARYREAFEGMLAARLEAAPEHIQALLKDMDALKALRWLDENAEKLAPAKPTPPSTNARDGARSPGSKDVALNQRVRL